MGGVPDGFLAWLRVGTGVERVIVALRVQKDSNNQCPNHRQSPDKENLHNSLADTEVVRPRNCDGDDHVGNAQRNDKPETKNDTIVHTRPTLKSSASVRMASVHLAPKLSGDIVGKPHLARHG